MTSLPSMSGRPRSRRTRSGAARRDHADRLGAGRGRRHLKAAGGQAGLEEALDLRLVIDNEDARECCHLLLLRALDERPAAEP